MTHRNFENLKFSFGTRRFEAGTKSCHQRRLTECPMCCCVKKIWSREKKDVTIEPFRKLRETVLSDYESLGRLIGLALLRKINFGIRFSNTFCDLLLRGGVEMIF